MARLVPSVFCPKVRTELMLTEMRTSKGLQTPEISVASPFSYE